MKRLPVTVPPYVLGQIRAQMLYIAQDTIDNALEWEDRLMESIDAIGGILGHAVDQEASDRLGTAVRKVVFERTYLIHYRVNETAVEIVSFRHGARLPRAGEP